MSAGKAYIAIELPPVHTWRLLRHENELPENYVIIGSIQVGREDLPAIDRKQLLQVKQLVSASAAAGSELCERCPLRARLIESPGEDG